jgi:malonyl CoA-acyl carrier protein transacylase
MWINISIGVVVTVVLFYTTYRLLRYRIAFQNLANEYLQKLSDNELLLKEINRLNQQINNKELENSDGFLKFVSDSRDWAFQYIEQVQKALNEFDEEVAPQLEWANTFGQAAGDTVHTGTMKKISEAYDKLKSILPENTETPNN